MLESSDTSNIFLWFVVVVLVILVLAVMATLKAERQDPRVESSDDEWEQEGVVKRD